MAYWRMKLRNESHGQDMWPDCKRERVAAITYPGIHDVDLRAYSRENHPPGWEQIGSSGGKGSIAHYAWDICGGDAIYIGDSASSRLVGLGYATAKIGELAYRFDANSPIWPTDGIQWCHLINMDWDTNFTPVEYDDRAPRTTVLPLKDDEVQNFNQDSQTANHLVGGFSEEQATEALLLDVCYPRYTPATQRLIYRKHGVLSQNFKRWLEVNYGIQVISERRQIDAQFESGGKRFLAEFKIAYQGDTRRAIREALGQILEYNHYPPRVSHEYWLLVLDIAPCQHDITFINLLRKTFHLPLSLGWKTESAFDFKPPLSF